MKIKLNTTEKKTDNASEFYRREVTGKKENESTSSRRDRRSRELEGREQFISLLAFRIRCDMKFPTQFIVFVQTKNFCCSHER